MKRQVKNGSKITKGMSSAVLLSIAIHAALFFLAGILVVFTVVKKKEIEFEPPKAVERPKMKLKKPKPRIKKSNRPKKAKHILAKVNPVNMPEIQLPELSGMGGDGLGEGIAGGFDTLPDLSEVTIFGGGQSIGNDFEGQLYSLRYDRNHRKNSMDPYKALQVIRDFIRSGWKPSKLARYYRSPDKLYTTHFMIPQMSSPMGPDAFGVPDIASNAYFVHYKGKLVCPVSCTNGITFRFRGSGDGFMFIRVDGEECFLACYEYNRKVFDWWQSSSADHRKYFMVSQLATVGDWITLEPGKPLDMEVLIGEWAGAYMAFGLVVEVDGVEYNEKGWQGNNPIFPAFKTEEFSQDMIDKIEFYLPEGEVSLTNGPVFRDYHVASKAAVDKEVEQPEPVVPPSADEGKTRMWTTVDGRTFEAELIVRIGKKVVFKNIRGKTFKIPLEQVSEKDREFIELEKPPDLKFSFSKQTRKRDYPSTVFGVHSYYDKYLPRTFYNDFSVTIEQTSPGNYAHELQAELFVVGSNLGGDAYVLLDRQESRFTLSDENSRSHRFGGKDVQLTKFWNTGTNESQLRGWKYVGYLVVVVDERGKIIAHETPKKWLFGNFGKLGKLSVGNYFDNTCSRVGAPRPKPYKYDLPGVY